jgi:hypothetical protein
MYPASNEITEELLNQNEQIFPTWGFIGKGVPIFSNFSMNFLANNPRQEKFVNKNIAVSKEVTNQKES